MKRILLGLILASVTFSSSAYFQDGNTLAQWNKSRKKANDGRGTETDYLNGGMMRGFVTATHDAYEKNYICTDSNVTVGQMEDVVGLYIDNHPEKRSSSATFLVAKALMDAFPCQK